MSGARTGYLRATRHPWACLLFLVPLLLAYELGVLWLASSHADALRNGADAWLRQSLRSFGLGQMYAAPALAVAVLVVWSLARFDDRPGDMLGVWTGMVVESVLFAVGLWLMSRSLRPFLFRMGIDLNLTPRTQAVAEKVVTYVGAGIYEELIFRLFLFAGLCWTLVWLRVPAPLPFLLAALASAATFATAHHLGAHGEPFNGYVFLFRMLAGIYFAAVFQWRGFGIAVGAHACYDVLVGAGVG